MKSEKIVIRGNTVSTPVKPPENPLPRVTEEDNGKFLRVQDGAWAAVDIPYAEEEEY